MGEVCSNPAELVNRINGRAVESRLERRVIALIVGVDVRRERGHQNEKWRSRFDVVDLCDLCSVHFLLYHLQCCIWNYILAVLLIET